MPGPEDRAPRTLRQIWYRFREYRQCLSTADSLHVRCLQSFKFDTDSWHTVLLKENLNHLDDQRGRIAADMAKPMLRGRL